MIIAWRSSFPRYAVKQGTDKVLVRGWDSRMLAYEIYRLLSSTETICSPLLFGCNVSLTLELLFSWNHGLDAVVHILDKVNFGSAESPSVWDIINVVIRLRVFTMDSTYLDVIFVGNCLEFRLPQTELRNWDMNWGTKGSSKVGRAGSNVTKMIIMSEKCFLLNPCCGLRETSEDCTDVSSCLHWDDS